MGTKEEELALLFATPGFCKPIEMADTQQIVARICGALGVPIGDRPTNLARFQVQDIVKVRKKYETMNDKKELFCD